MLNNIWGLIYQCRKILKGPQMISKSGYQVKVNGTKTGKPKSISGLLVHNIIRTNQVACFHSGICANDQWNFAEVSEVVYRNVWVVHPDLLLVSTCGQNGRPALLVSLISHFYTQSLIRLLITSIYFILWLSNSLWFGKQEGKAFFKMSFHEYSVHWQTGTNNSVSLSIFQKGKTM